MADATGVGRTNVILLGLGAAACLVLTLGMRRLATLAPTRAPLVAECFEILGARRSGAVRCQRDGGRVRIEAEVFASAARPALVRDLGLACWRRLDRDRAAEADRADGVTRLELRLVVDGAVRQAFAVPPPWQPRAPLEVLATRPAGPGAAARPPRDGAPALPGPQPGPRPGPRPGR